MHAKVESRVQPVVPCEPASERECPGRVGPFGLELGGRAGLEQQRRSRNRRADPAEAPPQITPQIEHTEMQARGRSEEHTSELQSHSDLVCRLLLEKKKNDLCTPNKRLH